MTATTPSGAGPVRPQGRRGALPLASTWHVAVLRTIPPRVAGFRPPVLAEGRRASSLAGGSRRGGPFVITALRPASSGALCPSTRRDEEAGVDAVVRRRGRAKGASGATRQRAGAR